MSDITHSAKKHINHSLTSTKTIESGMNAEFTDLRRELDDTATSVRKLLDMIGESRAVWTAVAKHQHDFVDELIASVRTNGRAREAAAEAQQLVRDARPALLDEMDAEHPAEKMKRSLGGFLDDVEALHQQYPDVELAFTELQRYTRKVDKLEDKADDKEEALQRNAVKLQHVQADYDAKLSDVLTRMRSAHERHDDVMRTVLNAFWLSQERYWSVLDEASKMPRMRSTIAADAYETKVDADED